MSETTFTWDIPKPKGHPDRQIEVDESYFMKYVLVDFSEYWRLQDRIRKMEDRLNQEIENEFFRAVRNEGGVYL